MAEEGSAAGRSRFTTRLGFVLSGVGAAVGLGSFWRFPQLTSQNGGGAFVLVFVVVLLVFGIPLLWAELALGQRAQQSPLKAFESLAGPRWRIVGVLFFGSSFVLLGYYTILTGYVVRYALASFGDAVAENPEAFLARALEGPDAVFFGLLVALATAGIVAAGVARGLEVANRFMMPALFFILLGLVFYAQLDPGAGAGRDFYLSVDWGEITPRTIQDALNQVFFAVGIGFGIMLTYASYTPPGRFLLPSATMISGSILVVGFLAGLMIFPLVFSQGLSERLIGNPDASSADVLFLTLPVAFNEIGGFGGSLLMLIFFLMLLFSALSSTIAALEVVVAILRESLGWTRVRANVIATEWYLILGVLAATSTTFFDRFNEFLGNIVLFLAVIALSLAFTFAIRDPVGVLLAGVASPQPWQRRAARGAAFITRFVAPVVLIGLFVLGLPGTLSRLLG